MSEQAPKLIGYWSNAASKDASSFPHPQALVRKNWLDARARIALLRYLRAAPRFEAYRGLSWCRFQCGIDERLMGHREFSDGVWVWPEGLAHYIERHDVLLPDEFVSHAISGWPPALLPVGFAERQVSLEFWLRWASQQARHKL